MARREDDFQEQEVGGFKVRVPLRPRERPDPRIRMARRQAFGVPREVTPAMQPEPPVEPSVEPNTYDPNAVKAYEELLEMVDMEEETL